MILGDANVLLDIVTDDPVWYEWSAANLTRLGENDVLAINPIIYSEVSIGFTRIEDLDDAIPERIFRRLPLPWDACYLAGKAFVRYRRSGGARRSPLPDFLIGAHAAVNRMRLLTRDPAVTWLIFRL
jgi:predicted nucleic acid-binding protein